jgi:hypothetical protein
MKKAEKRHFRLIGMAATCLLLGTVCVPAESVVQLINPSSAPILPGSTFVLDAVVSDLAPSALDGFDLTLAPLPAGITLTGTSSPLANWLIANNSPSGIPQINAIAEDTSFDVTSTATLAEFDFSVANDPSTQGSYVINFKAQASESQNLQDASGDFIPFTQTGATVDVVPEPSTMFLLLAGLVGFGLFFSTKRMSPAFLRP